MNRLRNHLNEFFWDNFKPVMDPKGYALGLNCRY